MKWYCLCLPSRNVSNLSTAKRFIFYDCKQTYICLDSKRSLWIAFHTIKRGWKAIQQRLRMCLIEKSPNLMRYYMKGFEEEAKPAIIAIKCQASIHFHGRSFVLGNEATKDGLRTSITGLQRNLQAFLLPIEIRRKCWKRRFVISVEKVRGQERWS